MTDEDHKPDLLIFSTVMERDIDLLLVEELRCSDDFRIWLLERLDLAEALGVHPPAVHRIRHSVVEADGDGAGESDIVVELKGPSGGASDGIALLIENKINAAFQPEQPERYQARAMAMKERKECKEAYCLLVAPEKYVASVEEEDFDRRLTYEKLREYFANAKGQSDCESQRLQHRAMVIEHAIYEWRRRGAQIVDEHATSFAEAYYQRAKSRAPSLKPDQPNARTKESVWFYFRNALTHIPEFQTPWDILHKTKTKNRSVSNTQAVECVQINMRDWARYGEDLVRERIEPLLDPGMTLGRAGKSLAIRLPTPTVDATKPADDQWPAIDEGLDAALRLQAWYDKHLQQLRDIAVELGA